MTNHDIYYSEILPAMARERREGRPHGRVTAALVAQRQGYAAGAFVGSPRTANDDS